MRLKILEKTELLSLLFALLFVLSIALFSFRAWIAFSQGSEQLQITQMIVSGTDNLLSSLKDAETGQRGFLLTGEDHYLDPYRKALTDLPEIEMSLSKGTVSRPDQVQRVERLRPLIQEKLDELEETIQLKKNDQSEQALAIVQTDRGQITMDRIRALCAEIDSVANSRLTRYSDDARSSANEVGLIGSLGSAVLFVLLFIATINIQRGNRRRQELFEALEQREEQVRESRDWLQTTLASIGDAVIATNPEGKVNFLNAVAESLTGWTNKDATGKSLDEVFSITNEETGATVESPVTKVLREGRIVGLANHTQLKSKKGPQIAIDDSAAPIRGANGKIAGVVLVFRDVSERKEKEQAVRRSVENFRLMADHAPVLIWISDVDKRCTWFNKPWLEFTGRAMDQEIGNGWTEDIHPDDHSRCIDAYTKAFEAQQPFSREYRLRRKDRQYRWMLDKAIPLYEAKGTFTGYIGSCVDIHEQKESEVEIRRANEDLSQFAFAASHDLQEPLRMITSYSQLLVQGYRGQLDEKASICIKTITDGTKRMHDLLADLLAYTHLSRDGEPISNPVDLNAIFQKSIENLRSAIDESGAVVQSDPLPVVLGREGHFIQLFQNLIDNAIKYRSGRPPVVNISANKMEIGWQVAVSDNGIGINEEYHQKVFGVFKRLHGRAIPGTGIGLAICQRVVERYGGRIWVESQIDKGSTFYFSLPAVE